MSARTFIDPATFAQSFANAATQSGVETKQVTQAAKQYLLSYLTAYYLVSDFNQIEGQNFQTPQDTVKFKDMSFEQLLDRVSQLNKY
ncbi:MAG TPA: hypothetical protein K8U88_06605 [Levilactobacillus hammesii]|uniref:Uncharacterized protein n=1 Tax=Levilactobacillus hammesii TaxID=267633 RepID=A0A921EZW1_9LACO|nr:hypothetical protein [Levilactobacillus hammesii]